MSFYFISIHLSGKKKKVLMAAGRHAEIMLVDRRLHDER